MSKATRLKYLRHERQVLLASYVAQNPRRLAQLRDQDENRAAAFVPLRLETMHDAPALAWVLDAPVQPGLQIVIQIISAAKRRRSVR